MMKKYTLLLFLMGLLAANLHAQWVQTGGPFGGLVNDFAQKGSHIFAATNYDGVYVSTDGGAHWEPANNGLPGPGAHEGSLTLLVKGQQVFVGQRSGVYVTSDNGGHWTSVSNGIEDRYVFKLLLKGDTLFAGTEFGMFRSSNNGASWQAINNGLPVTPQLPSIGTLTKAGNRIFAGMFAGVFYTDDNGNHWTAANTGLPAAKSITELFNTGTVLLAAVTNGKIYHSTNNGMSWAPASGITSAYIESFAQGAGKVFGCVSNSQPLISDDGGYTWVQMTGETPGGPPVTIFETGTTLLVGTPFSGVCASADSGAGWTYSNLGMKLNTTRHLAANGSRLFAVSPGELHSSTDNGTGWNRLMESGRFQRYTGFAFTPTHTFMASDHGVYASTDNGANWILSTAGLGNDTMVFALATLGNTVFAGTYGGVYRSADNGANWQLANPGIDEMVTCMAVKGNTIFAGTMLNGVFASTDNASTWTPITTDSIFSVHALLVHGNALLMANTNGVFRSTNGGISWTDISPVPSFMLSFEYLAVSGNVIFAGGQQGEALFASTDQGFTWTDIWANLPPQRNLFSLAANDEFLFAGVDGFSVWRMPLADMAVAETVDAFAVELGPNPFTDHIRVRLPENVGAISVHITDMAGKTMATVQNQGTELVWNRTGIPAGMYLLNIVNANGQRVVRRVVIY